MNNNELSFAGMQQQIFLELLRSYHNGVGVTHGAQPIDEVVVNLKREAYEMAFLYFYDEPAEGK